MASGMFRGAAWYQFITGDSASSSKQIHYQLIEEDYVFLGWSAVEDKKVVDYLKHNRQWPTGSTDNTGMAGKLVKGEQWNGLWLSSIVERCYAYATEYAMERPKTERSKSTSIKERRR